MLIKGPQKSFNRRVFLTTIKFWLYLHRNWLIIMQLINTANGRACRQIFCQRDSPISIAPGNQHFKDGQRKRWHSYVIKSPFLVDVKTDKVNKNNTTVFIIWNRISLCSPRWSRTHYVNQGNHGLRDLLVPVSWVLGLKAWFITFGTLIYF